MAITVDVNGVPIQYPQTGDTGWGNNATKFAEEVASVLGKIGQSQAPVNDDIIVSPGNLSVTSGNLSVGGDASITGNTTLTGNITVNGNSNLGNGTSDTTAITGIVNVDSGVLYVDPVNNRVGINDTTPSEALDVTGNALISGTLGVTGATSLSSTLSVTGNSTLTGNLSVNGNTTLGDASGDSLTINSNGISIPNGLNFDSNTFVIDATNNRIGINDSTPVQALDVTGRIALKSSSGSGEAYINLGESSTGTNNWVYGSNGAGDLYFYNNTASASNQRLAIQSTGQIQAVVPGGSTFYPVYLCRAWVNFNGTGTVAIRASGNVTSITDNGTGNYTVNLTASMPDADYSVVGANGFVTNGGILAISDYIVSSFRVRIYNANDTIVDSSIVNLAVFR